MNKIKENLSLIIVSVATIIYLLFIFKATELSEFVDLELNAKGDFLAGVFAPLAFLWLVFGYYQQGRELKLNTKALELQARELQISNESLKQQVKEMEKSVEAQRNLFELTQLQYHTSIEEKLESKRPKFGLIGSTYIRNDNYRNSYDHRFTLTIQNKGETLTNIVIKSNNWCLLKGTTGTLDGKNECKISILHKDREMNILFYLQGVSEIPFRNDFITISYMDLYGNDYTDEYKVEKNINDFVLLFKNTPHQ